jgi:hypothetical protein
MDRRSSSGTHFGSEVIARVASSHGVRLDGGDTGGIVEAFGEDTNIGLTVRQKHSAPITLGSTAASSASLLGKTVNVGSTGSTGMRLMGSTRNITGVQIYRVDFNIGNLSSAGAAASWEDLDINGGTTLAGCTTNAAYIFTPSDFVVSTGFTVGPVWCSTQGVVRLRVVNASAAALNPSTLHGTLMAFNTV